MNDDSHVTKSSGGWEYTDDIVKYYCVGKGVEIGPSDNPVKGVDTVLVDNKTDFAGKQYRVDYVMEADNLLLFQDNQFDFLIASHMLEHFPNPIKALKEWYRVVRDGGILFIVVPQMNCTFDRYRNVTKLSHLTEDYEKDINNPDPTHIDEWCNYSVPFIEAAHLGHPPWEQAEKSRAELKRQSRDGIKIDIHFHTWDRMEDMQQLMDYLGWEVAKMIDYHAIGRPLGAGNGILCVVRVRKPLVPIVKIRVLFLSHGWSTHPTTSTGIRFYEMAKRLSESCEVTLVTVEASSTPAHSINQEKFKRVFCNPGDEMTLKNYLNVSDVVILESSMLNLFPSWEFTEKILVFDLTTSPVLENLELLRKERDELETKVQGHRDILAQFNHQLRMGDYFICAHETQRNFWLGMLCSQNRIDPAIYKKNPSARNLVEVCSSGISEELPIHSRQALKGVYPGIKPTDKVLLWSGNGTDGLDPVTLIRAMILITRQRDDIKLLFMNQEKISDIINMAAIYGLYNTFVFFNSEIPYEDRQNYLLEADIGVSTHFANLEAQLSSGNRILDYIWAGLPIITTKGGPFSDLVERHQIGLTVEPDDANDLTAAILRLVENEALRQQYARSIRAISDQFTWKNTLKPLIAFCKKPRKLKHRGIEARENRKENILSSMQSQVDTTTHPQTSTRSIVGFFANLKTSLDRKRLKLTTYPSCKIWGKNQVGQSFIAEHPNLYRIDIKFATYFTRSSQSLTFHLKKPGIPDRDTSDEKEITTILIKASQIEDNVFYPFLFPQQEDSMGKIYYFYLESPDSIKKEALSVWCTESYSPMQFGCQPLICYERGWKSKGHTVFRAYYL
jgi:SAM-dependent methyltransferase